MASEIRGVHVTFRTERTLERSLFGVRPNMAIQSGNGGKRFRAYFTLERSDSGMRSDVELQVLFARKSFATVIAVKVFVVGMRSPMDTDRFVVGTNTSADVASHRFTVLDEMFVADVPTETAFGRKCVGTEIADYSIWLMILLHMLAQCNSIGEF